MAIIPVNIENLKPDKEYIVTVRSKNGDVNVVSDYADSVRFSTPKDSTIPNAPTGLELAVSFFSVLFKFNVSIDEDADQYEYELYAESQVEIVEAVYQPKSGEIAHRTGFSASNVFLISVESNSSTTDSGSVTNPVKYYGRVRTIDTSGNYSDWSQIVQSGDTPLIDEEYIGSLTAAKITAGTIGAHTIQLNGSSSILQSSNYVPGTSGWSIFGDGSAEFLNVTIGGDSTIENLPSGGGDFETVATNFNNRNDRISTVPNDPTNVAFGTDVSNLDASIDLTITWDFTVDATPTDAQNIDGFAVYLRTSTATNSSSITESDLNTNIYEVYLTSEKRSHTFAGISSSYYYTAAIRAYRIVDDDIDSDGILYSSLVNTSERAATTPLIGGTGIKIGSGKIYIGAGNAGSTDTGFYVDSTGYLSLRDKFIWNNSTSTLSIVGNLELGTYNYWRTNGTFNVGSAGQYVNWNGSTLTIAGDISGSTGTFTGNINSGSVTATNMWAYNTASAKIVSTWDTTSGQYIQLVGGSQTASSGSVGAGGVIGVQSIPSVSGTVSSEPSIRFFTTAYGSSSQTGIGSIRAIQPNNTIYRKHVIRISASGINGNTQEVDISAYRTNITGELSVNGKIECTSGSAIWSTYGYYIGLSGGQLFDNAGMIFMRSNYSWSAIKILASTDGVQVRSGSDGAYYAIRASAFNVNSSIDVKTDLTEARSSLDTLLNTSIYEWKYLGEKEDRPDDERITHIFPLAEDIPNYMLSSTLDDEKIIDIRDITGFLWKSSQEVYHDLNNKIAALEQRLQALES